MTRRKLLFIGICVLSSAFVAGAARAAVVLTFQPTAAPPGARVQATTVGAAMKDVPQDHFDLYLAPSQRVADAVSGRGQLNDARLVPIGRMNADEAGVGMIRFTVPRIEAGTYTAVAHCAECAQGESTFSAVGELVVKPGAALPNTGTPLDGVVTIALLLLAIGALGTKGNQLGP